MKCPYLSWPLHVNHLPSPTGLGIIRHPESGIDVQVGAAQASVDVKDPSIPLHKPRITLNCIIIRPNAARPPSLCGVRGRPVMPMVENFFPIHQRRHLGDNARHRGSLRLDISHHQSFPLLAYQRGTWDPDGDPLHAHHGLI